VRKFNIAEDMRMRRETGGEFEVAKVLQAQRVARAAAYAFAYSIARAACAGGFRYIADGAGADHIGYDVLLIERHHD
jgi:hypothetical protein